MTIRPHRLFVTAALVASICILTPAAARAPSQSMPSKLEYVAFASLADSPTALLMSNY